MRPRAAAGRRGGQGSHNRRAVVRWTQLKFACSLYPLRFSPLFLHFSTDSLAHSPVHKALPPRRPSLSRFFIHRTFVDTFCEV